MAVNVRSETLASSQATHRKQSTGTSGSEGRHSAIRRVSEGHGDNATIIFTVISLSFFLLEISDSSRTWAILRNGNRGPGILA